MVHWFREMPMFAQTLVPSAMAVPVTFATLLSRKRKFAPVPVIVNPAPFVMNAELRIATVEA